MITIKKGSQVLKVSNEAYKSMFKSMGYEIINEKEEAVKPASS